MKLFSQFLFISTISLVLCSVVSADSLSLYTGTRDSDPCSLNDSNWDWWQQDQGPDVLEDSIYLCMFDGASSHDDYQPEAIIDGLVDGTYSTLSMGPGGQFVHQSLGVSGTSPIEFPNNQRDTRATALVNLSKVMDINDNAGAIQKCVFRWSIDYVMPWTGTSLYLQAPTTLYISIFPAEKQNYWQHPPDDASEPNTPISDLQNEFDPNGTGILFAEKAFDLTVDDGPWGPGIQPLTNWYIEQNGVQFYEMDFSSELRQIVANNPEKFSDPCSAFVGFTIRASLDGEAVYLSMDARDRTDQLPIPPTLDIQVAKYLGNLDDDSDVELMDFALFSQQWLQSEGLLTADLDVSGTVDIIDLSLFCKNWLTGTSP